MESGVRTAGSFLLDQLLLLELKGALPLVQLRDERLELLDVAWINEHSRVDER